MKHNVTALTAFLLSCCFMLVDQHYTYGYVCSTVTKFRKSIIFGNKKSESIVDTNKSKPSSILWSSITNREKELPPDKNLPYHERSSSTDFQTIFGTTNVHSKAIPIPSSTFWDRISPPITSSSSMETIEDATALDVTVKFVDAHQGSIDLVRQSMLLVDDEPSDILSHHYDDEKCGCCDDNGSSSNKNMNKDTIVSESPESFTNIIDFFTKTFSYYQDIMYSSPQYNPAETTTSTGAVNDNNSQLLFKARLQSTYGMAGNKCPIWHLDYVTCRGLLSIVGPGCMYIPHENEVMQDLDHDSGSGGGHRHGRRLPIINRDALMGGLNVYDATIANQVIFPRGERCLIQEKKIVQAQDGDFVLLLGRGAWDDNENEDSRVLKGGFMRQILTTILSASNQRDSPISAAPHRSPDLGPLERRILLTLDVVED